MRCCDAVILLHPRGSYCQLSLCPSALVAEIAKRPWAVMVLAALWSNAAFAQSSGTRSSGFGYDSTLGLLTQEVVEPGTPSQRLQTES